VDFTESLLPEQIPLPGFEPGGRTRRRPIRTPKSGDPNVRVRARHSMFFALRPTQEAPGLIGQLTRCLGEQYPLGERLLPPERWHVMLLPMGGYPDLEQLLAMADPVRAAAARVSSRPFDITFNQVASLDRWKPAEPHDPVVLTADNACLAATEDFQRLLEEVMKRAGLRMIIGKRNPPHLTLSCSARNLVPRQAIEPIGWTAREFLLIRCVIGEAEHVELGRWTLAA
jgi:2'-5' RNA ligase